jgi:hypothetical protein
MSRSHTLRPWMTVLGRSLLVGGMCGIIGGALIFFLFGFIGFSGASLPTRIGNGWRAAVDPGLRKGLAVGVAIAAGLEATILLWTQFGGRRAPSRMRPWLSLLAAMSVVGANLQSFRTTFGWDPAGIATVVGIALLVGGIVWAVAPWVLERGSEMARSGETEPAKRGLHHG